MTSMGHMTKHTASTAQGHKPKTVNRKEMTSQTKMTCKKNNSPKQPAKNDFQRFPKMMRKPQMPQMSQMLQMAQMPQMLQMLPPRTKKR